MVLTEGSIGKGLLAFAVPLFLGNLFQQLYNAADSLIVGNFLGREALAAVSSSGNLIFMMVGFFNGFATGSGAIIARAYGAGDKERLDRAVHTAIAAGAAAGIALSVILALLVTPVLKAISTPADIMPLSTEYLRIIFAGIFFSVMYNILMGILTAAGDSRDPLIFLILSSIINIVLDILLIGGLGMGVWAAAAATVVSQAVSSVLCFLKLISGKSPIKADVRRIGFDFPSLKAILSYGTPAGVQNSVIGLANTIVQRSVNSFPASVIAGVGVYSKIEGFILLPITTISLALTTFVGQNLGAGKKDRAVKGAKEAIAFSMVTAEVLALLLFISAPFIVSLFSSDPEVIRAGARQARIEAFFYFLVAFSHGAAGTLRGAGKSSVPMAIILISWCVIRVILVNIAMLMTHSIDVIYSLYPVTWLISSALFAIYLRRKDWASEADMVDPHHRAG